MSRRRICVVSGGRADYGLLYWPMKEIQSSRHFELQVAVTGMHLSPEFGRTAAMLGQDGFAIDARVETLLSSDSAVGVAKSIGLGVIGFADAFARLEPDLLLLLGDRFEILAAAQAALVARLPIAHIGGGDTTEGAFDEAIRHSISKMSHLHFATHEVAARRLRQLGEDPQRIFTVGSPGIDYILRLEPPTRDALAQETGLDLSRPCLLVTYHPATLGEASAVAEFDELLAALDAQGDGVTLAFTVPNADTGGRALAQRLAAFVAGRPQARVFAALGSRLYLALLREAVAVVGNSSSGLCEAPSLGTPTVDVGERQQGRLKGPSVISCRGERRAIGAAIAEALARPRGPYPNPYGAGDSARRIVEILAGIDDFPALTRKRFFDMAGVS